MLSCASFPSSPCPPTEESCTTTYVYFDDGNLRRATPAAQETIADLGLDHATLMGWKSGALDGQLLLKEATPTEELRQIIWAMENPTEGSFPAFAFVIAQLARDCLALQGLRDAPPNQPTLLNAHQKAHSNESRRHAPLDPPQLGPSEIQIRFAGSSLHPSVLNTASTFANSSST